MNERNLTQSIVRSIADGLISTDLQGNMVGVNPKVEQVFGEEKTLVGKSCARLFERYGWCRSSQILTYDVDLGGPPPSLTITGEVTFD